MATEADRAARGVIGAFRLLARNLPGMRAEPAGPGLLSLVSGAPIPTLNCLFTEDAQPDLAEVDRAAADLAGLGLPWSVQLRGEPGADAERLADEYGLTARSTTPLMAYVPVPGEPAPPARASAAARVDVAGLADQSQYAAALAAGFEAPPAVMAPFSAPEAFAIPGGVPYLAREDGQVVAVGFGVFAAGTAGVFNIATVPAYRGRGYGRAISSRIVADGVERGADLAYLQATPDGYPLYESMGFKTVETWTYLCSPAPAA
jgi:ribosomal protein S18 acetylase RimI-like enzyme